MDDNIGIYERHGYHNSQLLQIAIYMHTTICLHSWGTNFMFARMMYCLAVIHDTSCISSLTSSPMYEHCILNSTGVLLVLIHAAIQVVYCHYMLTPGRWNTVDMSIT